MPNIGTTIKNFRMYRGLSQRELGDRLNKSSAVICNWEKGTNSPDLDSVEKLCHVLECTPNELLGWEENEDVQNFLKKKEYLVQEVEKLTKAREALDNQIANLVKQLDQDPTQNVYVYTKDEHDKVDKIPIPLRRRMKFIEESKTPE